VVHAASMRPGHRCPGNPWGSAPGPSWRPGFNEAGASMPRKSNHLLYAARCGIVGFNEAGASMPRKSSSLEAPRTPRNNASMRPGHRCPGNRGHRGVHARGVPASMRPGHRCPGNQPDARLIELSQDASMRPGHRCPGNRWRSTRRARRRACFNEAGASMPRKSSRAASGRAPATSLQ